MSRFIIDGYNLIKTRPEFKEELLATSRRQSVDLLQRAFSGSIVPLRQSSVTIVFDGRTDVQGPVLTGKGVRVVFSKGEKADDYIKRFVQTHISAHNVVVTNDRDLAGSCRRLKAQIWSVDQFMGYLGKVLEKEASPNRALSARDATEITDMITEALGKKYGTSKKNG